MLQEVKDGFKDVLLAKFVLERVATRENGDLCRQRKSLGLLVVEP
jgi:hypothetical protein